MKKKDIAKIAAALLLIAVYVSVLFYIMSVQSNYTIAITTEKEQYVFANRDGLTEYVIPVTVQNNSNRMLSTWDYNVFVSYHLYDSAGNLIAYDNPRSPLEKNILSTDTGVVQLHISRLEKGEYIIEIDGLEEGVTWYGQKEDTAHRIGLTVE